MRFRVDIITHWLAGHEPGNFGLFHIGIERGVSNVLDPHDIPVYLWENGKAKLVKLDSLKRTPLLTYYLRRNNDGQNEEKYHMCDEPFDYSSWKTGKISRQGLRLSGHWVQIQMTRLSWKFQFLKRVTFMWIS